MAGTVDPKLIHLIGRLIHSKQREDVVDDSPKNVNALVQQLCHQHREYQRKNITQLTRDVQSAVTHWQQREAHNNSSSNVKVKKRKHQQQPFPSTSSSMGVGALNGPEKESDDDEHDDDDEDYYDRAAVIHDTMVAATTSVTGSSLNDRLLQIRNVKQSSKTESSDNINPSTNTPKKSSFRLDIIDSQEEISESFADVDNHIDRVRTIATDNTLHKVSYEREAQITKTGTSTTKSSGNRKRKLIRRTNSRVDGDTSQAANLGPDGQAAASMSFTIPVERPTERYSDLGGMDHIITNIRQLVEYPITRPELYRHLGVDPPRGVLLRGPPGT
jgi:hypothetical protein